MDYRKEYTRWCALAKGLDADIEQELAAIRGEEEKIQDAFYRDLAFGTGGLRGVIGAGTNRMNVYTVAKASQGISLLDRLQALYAEYGYCLNTLHSFTFEGSAGFEKMQKIMQRFRTEAPDAFAGKKVEKVLDYLPGLDGLPKSDVLKYLLSDHCSVVVRPSGTEPKLKIYISISAENQAAAEDCEAAIAAELGERMK